MGASKTVLTLRLTAEEKHVIRGRAAEAGLSMESWARGVLLKPGPLGVAGGLMSGDPATAFVPDPNRLAAQRVLQGPPKRRQLTAAEVNQLSQADRIKFSKGQL